MGFGSAAKTLQNVADKAEKLYARMNDLLEEIRETKRTLERTNEQLDRLEAESAEQRAILEALADERGIDVESVTAQAHILEAEQSDAEDASEEGSDGGESGESESDAGSESS